MLAKIGFAGDLHRRPKDITTVLGYMVANNAVTESLEKLVVEEELSHFVSLGDWYDKGYDASVPHALSHVDDDRRLSDLLQGNLYGLIGNHIRLGMDASPELHIIQPHPLYKSRVKIHRNEQIMKTPDTLMIGSVQISFLHHRIEYESVEQYKPKREAGVTYHIALFHTSKIIPTAQLVGTNYAYNASPNSAIARTLEGVDLAIVGDVHDALGMFRFNETTMIVPGSLTNTDSAESGRHHFINLPIITIHDDSKVTLKFKEFYLHTNLITFKPKVESEANSKLQSKRGKTIEDLYPQENATHTVLSQGIHNLNDFMLQQNYTDVDKQLVRSVMTNAEDLKTLVKIFRGGSF